MIYFQNNGDLSTIQHYEDQMHKHLFKAYGYYRAMMQMKGLPYLQFHQFVQANYCSDAAPPIPAYKKSKHPF